MKTDISIECALPYSEDLADEQQKFEVAFNGLAKQLEQEHKTFQCVLLVDDMTNNMGDGFDLDAYTQASTESVQGDALIFRESMLTHLSDQVYEEFKSVVSSEELSKLRGEEGYSSPFYIAVWTLVRLGYLEHSDFPNEKVSKKIVNVLPESFRQGEEESMAIVRRTRFAEAADRVEYVFV